MREGGWEEGEKEWREASMLPTLLQPKFAPTDRRTAIRESRVLCKVLIIEIVVLGNFINSAKVI